MAVNLIQRIQLRLASFTVRPPLPGSTGWKWRETTGEPVWGLIFELVASQIESKGANQYTASVIVHFNPSIFWDAPYSFVEA
jgi:hypothetical protein